MSSKRKLKGKKHRHLLLILFLIVIGIFLLYREFGKDEYKPEKILKPIQPEKKHEILPKVAVVIDDLGSNKKDALSVFNIKASLTLSIIPHKTHTVWIADEGHRRGHDVIGHIPMEAKEPHNLGKGGLYTWMTDNEIIETLKEGLNSIPHAKGISNHMGSAFTEDERAMSVLTSALKERRIFFLDSLTNSKSVGFKIAEKQGVKALKRDMFLDDKDNPEYIEAQWKKLVEIAKKKGYAIALAHPKKNTINFLRHALLSKEVIVVPISELTTSQ